VVVDVELAVSVAVTALVPVTLTDDGIEQVTGLVAPLGGETEQLRPTLPVNPLEGVTLIVEVLPVVAPWTTAIFPLFESANVGVVTWPLTFVVIPRV
jgi:hypothetical protein